MSRGPDVIKFACQLSKIGLAALGVFACVSYAQPNAAVETNLRFDDVLPPIKKELASQILLDQLAFPYPRNVSCGVLSVRALARLTLMDTMTHILCKSPLVSQALMLVDERQAGVDLAASAFRPQLSARAELAANGIPSSNSGSGFLGASVTGSLGVSWLLFDAGAREGLLEQSRQSLSAAKAAQQTAALSAVNDALRLYVEAAVAWSKVGALRESEDVAAQSLRVAQAKHEAQVASLSEKLQAQTALAQAVLERVRAEGGWEAARGSLAVAMGLPAGEVLTLAPFATAFPGSQGRNSLRDRIDEAKRNHPRLRGARADLRALQSRLYAVRSNGKGRVSLSMGVGSTRDLRTPDSYFEHSVSGSVLASVPIFNAAEQQAQESQVVAQIASRESVVSQIERDIDAELWRNAKLLETEAQSLRAAEVLLETASQSHQAAIGRYKAGVGAILELMGAQAALATARSQMAQAQFGHAQARLRLEIGFGTLLFSP